MNYGTHLYIFTESYMHSNSGNFWVNVDDWKISTISQWKKGGTLEYKVSPLENFGDNYKLFSVLGGVDNRDNNKIIKRFVGLPKNITIATLNEYNKLLNGNYCKKPYNIGCITLKELKNIRNSNKKMKCSVYVTDNDYEKYNKDKIIPKYFMRGKGDGSTDDGYMYFHNKIEWEEPYFCLDKIINDMENKKANADGDDKTRIIYWSHDTSRYDDK